MSVLLTIFICLLLLALVYLTLNYKIAHSIDQIFRHRYQNQLKTDIQEFYRELENYAVIFENRIQRFKNFVERQEKQITKWESILSSVKSTKKAKEILNVVDDMIKNDINNPLKKESPTKVNTIDLKTKKIYKNKSMKEMPAEENFAEEIISDMPDKLYTESKILAAKPVGVHPVQKKEESQDDKVPRVQRTQTRPESMVTTFLGKLGGSSLSKILLKDSAPQYQKNTSENFDKKSSLSDNMNNDNQTKGDVTQGFEEIIHDKLPQPTPKEYQKKGPQEVKKKLLNEKEVIYLIQDLSDQKKKPMALQVLIKGGFTISEISDISKISYSDLETTRNIYGV